jgi:hypothetical protein
MTSNKTIKHRAGAILPATTAVLTAILFFIFRPDNHTAIFYLNLGYTILLEAIFFAYINLLYRRTTTVSTPFIALFGIYSLYYILLGTSVMLLYSQTLSHLVAPKIYIATLIALTLLWIIVSLLTAQVDSHFNETVEQLNNRRATLEYYAQKITMLASRYEKLSQEKGIRYATESNNRTVLDKLVMKIGFLSPNVLDNATVHSQLNAIIDKCEEIIEETALSSDEAQIEWEKKMRRFVNKTIEELDMIKNTYRR